MILIPSKIAGIGLIPIQIPGIGAALIYTISQFLGHQFIMLHGKIIICTTCLEYCKQIIESTKFSYTNL